MRLSDTSQPRCTPQRNAIGIAPIAGVPPVLHRHVDRSAAGGTPNPLHRRGSEFNQLAPHAPERLDAPRRSAHRQRRAGRGPPPLKSMARHGLPCPARPKSTDFVRNAEMIRLSRGKNV